MSVQPHLTGRIVIIVTGVGREGAAQKIYKAPRVFIFMEVPERGTWKFRVPSPASAFGRSHGSSEFRVPLQPSAGRIYPPAHPRKGCFAAKSVNLLLMGCHAVTDGMIDVSLHFRLKSSFCCKHKSSPLPLRGIPPYQGWIDRSAASRLFFWPEGREEGRADGKPGNSRCAA